MSIELNVGIPPPCSDGWKVVKVKFHDFYNLCKPRDEAYTSPKFSCFGHEWVLRLYPGGKQRSTDGYVAISLHNQTNTHIKLKHGFSIRDAYGKELAHKSATYDYGGFGGGFSGNCIVDFAKREELLKSLGGDLLVVEIRMKPSYG